MPRVYRKQITGGIMNGKGDKNRLRGKELKAYASSKFWENLEKKKKAKKEKK